MSMGARGDLAHPALLLARDVRFFRAGTAARRGYLDDEAPGTTRRPARFPGSIRAGPPIGITKRGVACACTQSPATS